MHFPQNRRPEGSESWQKSARWTGSAPRNRHPQVDATGGKRCALSPKWTAREPRELAETNAMDEASTSAPAPPSEINKGGVLCALHKTGAAKAARAGSNRHDGRGQHLGIGTSEGGNRGEGWASCTKQAPQKPQSLAEPGNTTEGGKVRLAGDEEARRAKSHASREGQLRGREREQPCQRTRQQSSPRVPCPFP